MSAAGSEQDLHVSRVPALRRRRGALAATRPLGRRPHRALPRRRAGTGQRHGRPDGRLANAASSWDYEDRPQGRSRRLSLPVRPVRAVGRRGHVAQGLRHSGRPCPHPGLLHPYAARRRLSRRRPSRAAYVIERFVDHVARDLGKTPTRSGASTSSSRRRCRTRPPPEGLRHRRVQGHMRRAMEVAQWDEFRQRLAEARRRGRIRGIGMASYIEACSADRPRTRKSASRRTGR